MTPNPQANTLDEIRRKVEQEINAASAGADTSTMPKNLAIGIPSSDLQDSINRIMQFFAEYNSALLSEARANERQAMLDAVPERRPETAEFHTADIQYISSTGRTLENNKGFNKAIDEFESAIKLRGGSK